MENINRNDIYNFFKDMPPDHDESESEVIHISQLCVK